MTSQSIKFYKFNNSTSSADKIASAKATQGAVIYLVDVRELWIGGATASEAKLVIKGANDVTFANHVLTLTHYDNAGTATTQTLDFSDVASASSTMTVFNQIYTKMGLTGQNHDTLDYTGTNYLTSATNLVDADKALDTAIHTNTHKGAATGAAYDTQHLSQTWTGVVNTNAIAANETLDLDIDKLDKKIAGLADEVIANEQVTQEAFTAVANSVGLESDMSLDLSDANLTVIKDDRSVKEALEDLDAAIAAIDAPVDDVRINGTTIVDANDIADIAVDGTYDANDNKIATKSTVTTAINNLDVATDKGAASISGSTITIKAVQQEDGLIKDGGTTTINLDGTYDATDNKIATKSTVTNAINALDTTNDVQAVDCTAATSSTGAKLTFKGVSETDGVIAQGSGATELQFAKVATTGAAADVSIADAGSLITATNVEDALQEIATNVKDLVGGMRYNGNINSTTATLNSSTHDIRPGDIYLASGAFTLDGTSVEAGDMIVYKGQKSETTVTLDSSNCTIIEKETDTMVTAVGTLADDYIVFGNGNKEVTTTSNDSYTITASQLNTAITKANSALQSISKGTDGTYVTTTIGSKDASNDQKVSVAVTQSTVTYTATSGSTGPDLSVASGNEGLLNSAAITPIKNYVDDKVNNVVSDLDVAEYQQASVTAANGGTTITVKGIKEENGEIAASTSSADTTILADGEYNASNNKLATQTTVSTAVSNAIDALDGSATIATLSSNVVTIKAGVTETNGVISNNSSNDIVLEEVAVTGAAADVSYDNTSSAMTATTVQAAIDELKSDLCWSEYE